MDSNSGFETVIFDFSESLSSYIINNGETKTIKTDAGNFNSKEFSNIAIDITTNEKKGEGESISYYYEDFLIQEFISYITNQDYVYKKELIEIQYQ